MYDVYCIGSVFFFYDFFTGSSVVTHSFVVNTVYITYLLVFHGCLLLKKTRENLLPEQTFLLFVQDRGKQ